MFLMCVMQLVTDVHRRALGKVGELHFRTDRVNPGQTASRLTDDLWNRRRPTVRVLMSVSQSVRPSVCPYVITQIGSVDKRR
jgi:hypothetical protein